MCIRCAKKVTDQNQMFQIDRPPRHIMQACEFYISIVYFANLIGFSIWGRSSFCQLAWITSSPFLQVCPWDFLSLNYKCLSSFYDELLLLLYCRLHLVFVSCFELQKLNSFRWRIVSQRAMFELNFAQPTSNLGVLKASFERSNKLIKLDPCVHFTKH